MSNYIPHKIMDTITFYAPISINFYHHMHMVAIGSYQLFHWPCISNQEKIAAIKCFKIEKVIFINCLSVFVKLSHQCALCKISIF